MTLNSLLQSVTSSFNSLSSSVTAIQTKLGADSDGVNAPSIEGRVKTLEAVGAVSGTHNRQIVDERLVLNINKITLSQNPFDNNLFIKMFDITSGFDEVGYLESTDFTISNKEVTIVAGTLPLVDEYIFTVVYTTSDV